MKRTLLNTLCIVSVIFVFGCNDSKEQFKSSPLKGDVSRTDMEEIGKSGGNSTHYAVGKVTNIDREIREMVINMEPVADLGWSASSKTLQIAEEEQGLVNINSGDKIEFYLKEVEPGRYVATNLNVRQPDSQ